MTRILIVEDEETLRRSLARHLKRRDYEVLQAGTCAEAREILRDTPEIDVVLADVMLPDGRGFDVVDQLEGGRGRASVVVMTGQTVLDHAIAALRHGADDFLTKPFSLEALDHALDRLRSTESFVQTPPASEDDLEAWRQENCPEIVGRDPALMRVFDIVRRVADTDCSVLVTGETGTGKELVAKAIHRASTRREKAFVPVNCASIPETLMESELFGHAKGAFTGATGAHKGRFAVADGGTLMLDEIGEMAMQLQAKLLRVLQEGEIRPVGESKSQKVDVRVVAATHRDVEDMAERGDFREDLLYRLDVIRIELPPLRSRPDDVPLLAEHFIREAASRRNRNITGIDEEGMDALKAFHWPGNARQLRHTIERMVVLGADGELTIDDVPARIREARGAATRSGGQPILPETGLDLKDAVEQFENALIRQALERTGWNKNQAANILQMNRTTLVEKLKKKKLTKSHEAA
ncbi:MAG TPA: sigma-54 dependent transcriptional regulator [Sandaracinaceae bacterium LLY-WYZ-13_1]|nr:sigma-54 dependent transcriptional regulator [Sandaracinaceae bacterium LLY-WYZ-13_1]